MTSDADVSNEESSLANLPTTIKTEPDDEHHHEEEDADVSEYEIEEVLDAKRGYFPGKRMGYLVKWKGYDDSENSWVDEMHAGDAIELINQYWKKRSKPTRPKMPIKHPWDSTGAFRSKSAVPGPPDSAKASSSSNSIDSTKKRSRESMKSPRKKRAEDNDNDDVEGEVDPDDDDEPPTPPKKARKSSKRAPAPPRSAAQVQRSPQETVDGQTFDWEMLVESIDGMERDPRDGTLRVSITLVGGTSMTQEVRHCKQLFPKKLLEFYERNVKFVDKERN